MKKQVWFSWLLLLFIFVSCNPIEGVEEHSVNRWGEWIKGKLAVFSGMVKKKERWDQWFTFDDTNPSVVTHELWDSFLDKYVMEEGTQTFLKYRSVTDQDKIQLSYYLAYLASIPITRYARDEQYAYWINLYNALTVTMVLQHYPVKSIRKINISPGNFTRGPWGKRAIGIEGYYLSLNDIQHKILRPIWADGRIHYALSDASIGAPNLSREAYVGSHIDAQLDAAEARFLSQEKAISANKRGKVTLSSLFEWYLYDFAEDEESLVAYLKSHASGEALSALNSRKEGKALAYTYDWALNDADKHR